MIPEHIKTEIVEQIDTEAERMRYGKLYITATIVDGEVRSATIETRRSFVYRQDEPGA